MTFDPNSLKEAYIKPIRVIEDKHNVFILLSKKVFDIFYINWKENHLEIYYSFNVRFKRAGATDDSKLTVEAKTFLYLWKLRHTTPNQV